MTNLKELSGLELRQEANQVKINYNTYKLTKEKAILQLNILINEINDRACKIAEKYNKSPYFINISHFI